jgi:hypothetical protein
MALQSPQLSKPLLGVALALLLFTPVQPVRAQQVEQELVRVMGTVADAETGQLLPEVEVAFMNSKYTTHTDSLGWFEFNTLPPGRYVVRFRRIGYHPLVTYLEMTRGQTLSFEVELLTVAIPLPALIVEAPAPDNYTARLEAFELRMRGGQGYFFTPEAIEEMRPQYPSDIVMEVPGAMLYPCGLGTSQCVRFWRGRARIKRPDGPTEDCDVQYFIDGQAIPLRTMELDRDFGVGEILAVEVYTGISQLPSELKRLDTFCGAIVIWTR